MQTSGKADHTVHIFYMYTCHLGVDTVSCGSLCLSFQHHVCDLIAWAEFSATAWGLGDPWRARYRDTIRGVWGQSPQWGPGAEPLVGFKVLLTIDVHNKAQNHLLPVF